MNGTMNNLLYMNSQVKIIGLAIGLNLIITLLTIGINIVNSQSPTNKSSTLSPLPQSENSSYPTNIAKGKPEVTDNVTTNENSSSLNSSSLQFQFKFKWGSIGTETTNSDVHTT